LGLIAGAGEIDDFIERAEREKQADQHQAQEKCQKDRHDVMQLGVARAGRNRYSQFMRRFLLILLFAVALGRPAGAQPVDRFFYTSDGVRLHYLQAGPADGQTIVLVPGWTMPGWIFAPQIAAFSRRYRVIAFDPRGQGISDIAPGGYNQDRRGQDIAELLDQLGSRPVVLVGWSLGVLDVLAYIHADGDARVAGLVLVDNSVGERPAPVYHPAPPRRGPLVSHAAFMRAFVAGMFRTRQSPYYLERLTEACLRTPEADAAALLAYPVPRTYWKAALLSTDKPVLYVVRPALSGQAHNLILDRPDTQIAIFSNAGHALFVDDATKFDSLMGRFLVTTVWPGG
jgi:microsomal epoxide hydrolase